MIAAARHEMANTSDIDVLVYIAGNYLDRGLDHCNKYGCPPSVYARYEQEIQALKESYCNEILNAI